MSLEARTERARNASTRRLVAIFIGGMVVRVVVAFLFVAAVYLAFPDAFTSAHGDLNGFLAGAVGVALCWRLGHVSDHERARRAHERMRRDDAD